MSGIDSRVDEAGREGVLVIEWEKVHVFLLTINILVRVTHLITVFWVLSVLFGV